MAVGARAEVPFAVNRPAAERAIGPAAGDNLQRVLAERAHLGAGRHKAGRRYPLILRIDNRAAFISPPGLGNHPHHVAIFTLSLIHN